MILALALVAVGLVWIGQGLGVLRGSSFMVGDQRWAVIGAVALVLGAAIALSARRSRPGA
jgi:predicted anti-sigma-YlaC factor YlaD